VLADYNIEKRDLTLFLSPISLLLLGLLGHAVVCENNGALTHQDSVVREINPYSNEPYRSGHQPKVTASPPSAEADICSPKEIQQGEAGNDRQNGNSPYKWFPGHRMQPALLRYRPTGRGPNHIGDGAYRVHYEQT
jgi:hypothetical protein